MPRFFVESVKGSTAYIEGEDALHITKSLRMRSGEEVILCDSLGTEHTCVIKSLGSVVELEVLSSQKSQNEPDVKITLFQAVPKGDKLELIVQKAVELGVHSIVPVLTQRCISRPDPASFNKRLTRLNRIALEAAKQSGRAFIPKVENMLKYTEALDLAVQKECVMLFYEGGGSDIKEILGDTPSEIAIFIGSEGGFSREEVDMATQKGIGCASLGNRILRCETAPIAALSVLMYLTGNLT